MAVDIIGLRKSRAVNLIGLKYSSQSSYGCRTGENISDLYLKCAI